MNRNIALFVAAAATILTIIGCTSSPQPEEVIVKSEPKAVDPQVLTGIWQGVIQAGGQEIRLIFHFAEEGEEWTATMDSPDQGAEGIPVKSVEVSGREIVLTIPAAAATYEGKIDPSKLEITGTWRQGGGSLAVDLKKIEKVEKITRPQDPVGPFPYDEEEVTFTNERDGVTLAGTLTVPRTGGPFPGVILVSGSGPQNRNEELMNHRPFLVLADHLTRKGIAVLRYDDRGVGESGGNPATATSENFAYDAYAAFKLIESRPEIDAGKTGIIGHSEGGIIAPMIAAKEPGVDFIVLLAAPGIPGRDLLLEQSAAILKASGATGDQIDRAREANRSIYEVIIDEKDTDKAKAKLTRIYEDLDIPEERIEAEIESLLNPWLRFFLTYDPAEDLKEVDCPVLALNGSLDLQVPADENLAAIEEAVKKGGNQKVRTVKLDGLNHLFQHAKTGLVQEYAQIEETFAPKALTLISEWILETTG